jgi:hypothetical protein
LRATIWSTALTAAVCSDCAASALAAWLVRLAISAAAEPAQASSSDRPPQTGHGSPTWAC